MYRLSTVEHRNIGGREILVRLKTPEEVLALKQQRRGRVDTPEFRIFRRRWTLLAS